jgi:hypothetical protein
MAITPQDAEDMLRRMVANGAKDSCGTFQPQGKGERSINQSSGPSVGRPAQLEAEIQAACVAILEADGWRHLRTDPVSDRKRGKGFGELGMADSMFIRYQSPPLGPLGATWCQVLWIEWKRGLEHATPHQVAWHQKERARGALTWIANEDFPATVEEFRAHYRASGLCRNTHI